MPLYDKARKSLNYNYIQQGQNLLVCMSFCVCGDVETCQLAKPEFWWPRLGSQRRAPGPRREVRTGKKCHRQEFTWLRGRPRAVQCSCGAMHLSQTD